MEGFMFRFPSPSHVISITALVISLGGAGYSATGGSLFLGRANSATAQTKLLTPLDGAAFRVENTSKSANATGMTIVTDVARPPRVVTSSTKVANFNADKLDGIDAANLTNRLVVPFNLASGGLSAPITVPANRPVLVIGATSTGGHGGVSQMTLVRIPDESLTWVGVDAAFRIIGSGRSSIQGQNIVTLDANAGVFIQVNDANSICISNVNPDDRAGIVTLIW
jgi:hypothetical protein